MTIALNIFETLLTYFVSPLQQHVLHIAGPNACGKSTFIYEFLQFLIPKIPLVNVYYIDTEQKFKTSKYQASPTLGKIKFAHIHNITELNKKIQLWLNNYLPLNKGDIIIIDSLSELCKQNLSKTESWGEYFCESKDLYHNLFAPLIRLTTLKQAWLILTHHAVYSPVLKASAPAFNDFAHLINGFWVLMAINAHQTDDQTFASERMLELIFEFKKSEGLQKTSNIFSRKYLYRISDRLNIFEEIRPALN